MAEQAENARNPAEGVERARAAFEGFPEHWQIASHAIQALSADDRVLGLYLSGSFARQEPDRWSDIDLFVVVANGEADELIRAHDELIREVADVATLFPAIHLGDPHQIIVFYKGSEPIHVDYQYRQVGALKPQQNDRGVIIVLDRTGELQRWQRACDQEHDPPSPTVEDLQYLEDRFWGWCWYTHSKIERGELWEARDAVEYLRSRVLLPLAHIDGQSFEGNRRLETKLPRETLDLLTKTIPAGHSASDYADALSQVINVYRRLFDQLPARNHDRVRLVDRDYFEEARS